MTPVKTKTDTSSFISWLSVWVAERAGWITFVDGNLVERYFASVGLRAQGARRRWKEPQDNQSWPFRHAVSATAWIIGAGGGIAGVAAAANLSQSWVTGVLLATVLAAIAFVAASFSSMISRQNRLIQQSLGDIKELKVSGVDRVDADWQKVHEALHDFSAFERTIQDEIAVRDLDVSDCARLTDKLLGVALTNIQRAFERFCPEVVCSIKIPRRTTGEEFFECVYWQSWPPRFHELVDSFKVDVTNNYAGQALDRREIVFSGNLWKTSEAGDEFMYPYDKDVGEKLKKCGVQGVIAAPIFLKDSVSHRFEPRAVFKIDYFVVDGLIDNHPTRRTIEIITTRLGSLLQQSLTLCGSTIDDLTLARTVE